MRAFMAVNNFTVEVGDGYPYWTVIKYHGEEIARVHHKELKDLEYALGRCRDDLRVVMLTNEKHEA